MYKFIGSALLGAAGCTAIFTVNSFPLYPSTKKIIFGVVVGSFIGIASTYLNDAFNNEYMDYDEMNKMNID